MLNNQGSGFSRKEDLSPPPDNRIDGSKMNHIGRLREEKVEGVRVEDVSVDFAEEGEAE